MTDHLLTTAAGLDPAAVLEQAEGDLIACRYDAAARSAADAIPHAAEPQVRYGLLRVAGLALLWSGERPRESVKILTRAHAVALESPVLMDVRGKAAHNIAGANALGGFAAAATHWRRVAERQYASDDPGRIVLAADAAWIDLANGAFAKAVAPLLECSEGNVEQWQRTRATVHASVALAGLQDRSARATLERAHAAVSELEPCAAWDWYGLAWAASLSGREKIAAEWAGRARRRAAATGEVFAHRRALDLLRSLSRRP